MEQLNFQVLVQKVPIYAMIDTRVTGNFISSEAVTRFGLVTVVKKEPYKLTLIDRKVTRNGNNGMVILETKPIIVGFVGYYEWISLDVTAINEHDMILGMT